jgi:predicted glycoside hydrolase/deacetylase ChbG (UPF0249 family)
MPRLAPGNVFPGRTALIARALLGRIDRAEVAREIERQLEAFESGMDFAPDHIDGHEHVHVLYGVRQALFDVVSRRYARLKPLLRDPSDSWRAINARGVSRFKASVVAALALGFGTGARKRGLPTNSGFSGFSEFDVREPYAHELERALTELGTRHMVMCHPGHADEELAAIDPVVDRRRMEYDALMRDVSLSQRLWRPARQPDGPPIDWSQLQG